MVSEKVLIILLLATLEGPVRIQEDRQRFSDSGPAVW